LESDFDFCVRRAAEEFVAANRAQSIDQRKHHRKLAEGYADRVRAMRLGHHDAKPAALGRTHSYAESSDDAQAA
jgi:hypothetical protein